MKWTKLNKQSGLKIKAGFDWNNIGKVVDAGGKEYTLTKIDDNHIRSVGAGHDRILQNDEVFPFVDIYDKQGNLVNDMEDYD